MSKALSLDILGANYLHFLSFSVLIFSILQMCSSSTADSDRYPLSPSPPTPILERHLLTLSAGPLLSSPHVARQVFALLPERNKLQNYLLTVDFDELGMILLLWPAIDFVASVSRRRDPLSQIFHAQRIILAYDRSRPFFYAYFAIKMFTGMFCDGSMQCLSLAYVADKVAESRRATAFGVLGGISAAGFVSGTLAARFLPTSYTFQVSAAVAVLATVYMRLFLVETDSKGDLVYECSQPLCPASSSEADSSSPKLLPIKKVPSLRDMICLLRSSLVLLRAALVTFFVSFGDSGLQAALLYFLKAKFQFSKDQFADLLLIIGIAGAFSQLFLMLPLTRIIGEEKLLSIGLLASCAYVFLCSVAWASWVPYLASLFVVMSIFVHPCIRSTVSQKVGPFEQGMAQGCMTGINSFASIISPFVFSPLTALFLSEGAPFNFKGFSIMCCGFSSLTAFTLFITMRETHPVLSKNTRQQQV
ncbi:hippocampus abundant transcript-like protein 1 isoform X1 [Asparagus officinalis]|uniref:hippocampus abundant transcript-like protein 1 isoform X1 n=1 Tax=Asparagus officinalis TaxID=4686 RepID=UPI00098E7F77|nr:hippocampus abundant transcript-like protein 1 isoform X1 [Asparagus officinalis]